MTNRPPRPDMAPLASLAILLGSIMLLAGVAESDRLPDWTADYGMVLTVMAVVTYLGVAARILHWGIGELLDPVDERG